MAGGARFTGDKKKIKLMKIYKGQEIMIEKTFFVFLPVPF